MLEGLLLEFDSLLRIISHGRHVLVIVGDQLLEEDQRHERAHDRDAVLLHDLVLMRASFDQL